MTTKPMMIPEGEYLEKIINLSLPVKELAKAIEQAEAELLTWGAKPEDIRVEAIEYKGGKLRISSFKGLSEEVLLQMKNIEAKDKEEKQDLYRRVYDNSNDLKGYQKHIPQMLERREKMVESSLAKMTDLEETRRELQSQIKRDNLENKAAKEQSLEKVEKVIEHQQQRIDNLRQEISYLQADDTLLKTQGIVPGMTLKYLTVSELEKSLGEFYRLTKVHEKMQEMVKSLKVQGTSMNEIYRSEKDTDYIFRQMLGNLQRISELKQKIANF